MFSKLNWHKRTHGHTFTGAEFRVLMSIFDHSDEHGRKSHPGLRLLMAETGYGKSAVSEALSALQERGWIAQTRRGSGTSGKTSVYELVPDAPSSTAGAVPPDPGGSTAGADQPTEVGPVERTSWSAGADTVVPLERTPTDPDTRSGSDPSRSDQREVRYPPNHQGDRDDTGPKSRCLAIARSEATGGTAVRQPAKLRQAASASDDPFASEPVRLAEVRSASAGVDWSQHEPGDDQDTSAKARAFKAHTPFWTI